VGVDEAVARPLSGGIVIVETCLGARLQDLLQGRSLTQQLDGEPIHIGVAAVGDYNALLDVE